MQLQLLGMQLLLRIAFVLRELECQAMEMFWASEDLRRRLLERESLANCSASGLLALPRAAPSAPSANFQNREPAQKLREVHEITRPNMSGHLTPEAHA